MKRQIFSLTLIATFLWCAPNSTQAQFKGLKKLTQKAKQAAESILEDELENETKSNQPSPNSNGSSSSVRGNKLTPPNINEHLTNAKSALNSKQWSNARFEVKEALRGVEIEIGYQILDAMPKTASGISYNPQDDGVVSTGIGFVGMVVARYYGKQGKHITASIGNNSALGASYSLLINSNYSSNDGEHKNVTVQGYRGSINFDGYNTYTLGVPFGQSSALVIECEECSDEQDVMTAVKSFDISKFEDILKDQGADSQKGTPSNYLSTASSKYSSKNLEGARFNLQQSLVEIDVLIGEKILEMLPSSLGGLSAVNAEDENVATAAGFAGVYVKRLYQSADKNKSIEISLIDDSPLMSVVSSFMSNPLLVGMSGKKSISIDGYKGMKEKVEGSDPAEYNLNIPHNSSMLTIKYVDFSDSDVTSTSNRVPVGDIFKLIK